MRRLGRKTLYTNDNSLEVRVEQLERRFATPELEYVLWGFNTVGSPIAAGDDLQLPMDDEAYPFGQYGSALNPPTGPNYYGYSIVDDYIQCNTFGKDGFWHLFAGVFVTNGAPDTPDLTSEVQLLIIMELWDEDDVFVGDYDAVWMLQGVDNRTSYSGDTLQLRTQAMFFNGGVGQGERARFQAHLYNNSPDPIQISPRAFTMIRYGNAIGQITAE